MIDFSRTWLPYIYLYVAGGAIFIIGMYIILKSRSLNRDRIRHTKWFYILIFGLLYYMSIHSFFILAAIGETIFSGVIGIFVIALSLQLVIILKKQPNKV